MTDDMPTKTQSRGCLERLVRQLLDEARGRKIRVRIRLLEMRGDWLRYPVRGPLLPNGRPSLQWITYHRAVRNHKRATDDLAALMRVLPNDKVSDPAGQTETKP